MEVIWVRLMTTTLKAAMSDVTRSPTLIKKKAFPELPRSSRSHCLCSSGDGLVVLGGTESSQMSTEGHGSGALRSSGCWGPSRGIVLGVGPKWISGADYLVCVLARSGHSTQRLSTFTT